MGQLLVTCTDAAVDDIPPPVRNQAGSVLAQSDSGSSACAFLTIRCALDLLESARGNRASRVPSSNTRCAGALRKVVLSLCSSLGISVIRPHGGDVIPKDGVDAHGATGAVEGYGSIEGMGIRRARVRHPIGCGARRERLATVAPKRLK